MKASELIKHLTSLIEKYGDLPVVGMGMDGDYGEYSITEFDFEKGDLVKAGPDYYNSKGLPTTPVFVIDI